MECKGGMRINCEILQGGRLQLLTLEGECKAESIAQVLHNHLNPETIPQTKLPFLQAASIYILKFTSTDFLLKNSIIRSTSISCLETNIGVLWFSQDLCMFDFLVCFSFVESENEVRMNLRRSPTLISLPKSWSHIIPAHPGFYLVRSTKRISKTSDCFHAHF